MAHSAKVRRHVCVVSQRLCSSRYICNGLTASSVTQFHSAQFNKRTMLPRGMALQAVPALPIWQGVVLGLLLLRLLLLLGMLGTLRLDRPLHRLHTSQRWEVRLPEGRLQQHCSEHGSHCIW